MNTSAERRAAGQLLAQRIGTAHAYDLRKLRRKNLAVKPGRTRRYHLPPEAARTIAALLTLRDHIIAPILAGVRSPRRGRKPATWTRIDRDYEPSASECKASSATSGSRPSRLLLPA